MIINLTPHAINIYKDGVLFKTIEPYGLVARVKTVRHIAGEIDGVPIYDTQFGEVENLPKSELRVRFIVSSMVLAAVRAAEEALCGNVIPRDDLLVPGELVRDAKGVIIGCTGLSR